MVEPGLYFSLGMYSVSKFNVTNYQRSRSLGTTQGGLIAGKEGWLAPAQAALALKIDSIEP